MIEIGNKIKKLREDYNLSQTQLAKQLGYDQTLIAKWESNDRTPNLECVVKIAKIFNITTDYLLGLED